MTADTKTMAAAAKAAGAGKTGVELSVLVAADGDSRDFADLIGGYLDALDALGTPYEMICVYDQAAGDIADAAAALSAARPEFEAVALRPWSGEDGALKVGIDRARGARILVLPGWSEVDPAAIGGLLDALGSGDMVVGRREGMARSGLQKLRMGVTHGLIRTLFGKSFGDVFCRARAGRREVFAKVSDLGVRQHFLPVVAAAEGWDVREAPVAPASGTGPRAPVYSFKPFAHVSALVDLITLFVGLKFLRRPLRFFGAIGLPLFLIGLLATLWLVFSRLVLDTPLGDRPALVFSVLLIILGLQIVALGLVGEIVIFASSRRMRTYEIETIIRGRPQPGEAQIGEAQAGAAGAEAPAPKTQ